MPRFVIVLICARSLPKVDRWLETLSQDWIRVKMLEKIPISADSVVKNQQHVCNISSASCILVTHNEVDGDTCRNETPDMCQIYNDANLLDKHGFATGTAWTIEMILRFQSQTQNADRRVVSYFGPVMTFTAL